MIDLVKNGELIRQIQWWIGMDLSSRGRSGWVGRVRANYHGGTKARCYTENLSV